MVTKGSFDFFQRQLFSNFYDAQARALFHGHWYMPPGILSIEAIRTDGHSYMYYGPVPAILRMPVLILTSRLDGRLTSVSMLVAFVVCLVCVSRLSWKVRNLARRRREVRWPEAALAGSWVAVIGIGSAFFYLASRPSIYHEAELWGAALALAAFDALIAFMLRPSGWRMAAAGTLATASILTRGSVGAGPVSAIWILAAVSVAAWAVRRWRSASSRGRHGASSSRAIAGPPRLSWLGVDEAAVASRWIPALVAAALVPVVLYAWINYVKFHTLFSLPLTRQVFTSVSVSRRAALAANGGSLFGVKFIPTALLEYLRPDRLSIHRLFPFLGFPGPAAVVGHVRYDTLDWSSSATATMPALVATGVLGLIVVFVRPGLARRDAAPAREAVPAEVSADSLSVLRIPLVGAAIATLGALDIAYVANRYLSDFMPFIAMASLAGIFSLSGLASSARAWLRALLVVVVAALALFGMWANFALGLVYQRQLSPDVQLATRAGFVSFQEKVDKHLFGNPPTGVRRGNTLPKPAGVGDLFVLGSCQGLYQSDGRQWYAVERSLGAGLVRMRLSFPEEPAGTRQPLLVTGSAGQGDVLAVHFLGHNMASISYLFEPKAWIEGTPFSIVAGREHTVDAVLDSHIHEISVSIDGNTVFDDSYFVRPASTLYVGQSPFPAPVQPRFTGRLEELPVQTQICDSLVSRMGGKA